MLFSRKFKNNLTLPDTVGSLQNRIVLSNLRYVWGKLQTVWRLNMKL